MACADCAKTGHFWKDDTTGKELKLQGIESYVAQPKSKSDKGIILICDIHGWKPKNTRLLADKFAASGFVAAVPELFQGNEPPLAELAKGNMEPVQAWKAKLEPDTVIPLIDKVIAGLSSDYGVKSVGAIGFCWGGRFSLLLAGTDKVKAAVMNHGSFVTREEIEGVKQPFLINASDNDFMISRERLAQYQGVLDCKKNVPTDAKLFEGMEHGWTLRGDAEDPKVGPAIVEAFDRADAWFKKYV